MGNHEYKAIYSYLLSAHPYIYKIKKVRCKVIFSEKIKLMGGRVSSDWVGW